MSFKYSQFHLKIHFVFRHLQIIFFCLDGRSYFTNLFRILAVYYAGSTALVVTCFNSNTVPAKFWLPDSLYWGV